MTFFGHLLEYNMPKTKSRSGMGETSTVEHEEHVRLADILKGVHADLRNKFRASKSLISLSTVRQILL